MRKPSTAERIVSFGILVGLLGLMYWLINTRRPNPPLSRSESPAVTTLTGAEDWSAWLPPPAGYVAEAVEVYTAENAYEKINGKVEFYLPLGLHYLTTRKFVHTNRNDWLEVMIFKLGSSDAALSALTVQGRQEGIQLWPQELAYLQNFLLAAAKGPYYLEISASSTNADLQMASLQLASNLLASWEPAELPFEWHLFPSEYVSPRSIALYLTNGLGFEGFDRLFVASWTGNAEEITLFLQSCRDEVSAASVFSQYANFLSEAGATFEGYTESMSKAATYNLLGTYTVVFQNGRFVGGAHQAPSSATALKAAETLLASLRNKLTQ